MIGDFIASFDSSALAIRKGLYPWMITSQALDVVRELLATVDPEHYHQEGDVAIHRGSQVEAGAVLKGPILIGPACLIAAGAYLRGGVWLEGRATIGPGSEIKSSFLFAEAKLAHFNFVGDSILGEGTNLEAGSIVANHRNERAAKQIHVRYRDRRVATGVEKFGALVGDHTAIGANAVLAPGTLLAPRSVVPRLSLIDQDPDT
ncbi:LpxA family transferase [Boseaceae bacterium BT-24-1]|nr:LpxA family transferase [Boseaceae bacterium BT-24-1]